MEMKDLKRLFNERPPNVIAEIAPGDVMHSDGTLHEHYFHGGQRALRLVRLAMLSAMKEDLGSILDLPSGHGRVLRTLKAAFPDARLTACDINREAVDFCARTFGATPAYSSEDPAQIAIDDRFDLIYCGSLLTHLDERGWDGFLALFERLLADDGILVFTTGGRHFVGALSDGRRMFGLSPEVVPGLLEDLAGEGFGYRDWPGVTGYGIAVAHPWWVCRRLERFGSLRLLGVSEGAPQDAFACLKGDVDDAGRVSR
jgi:SAM-dependent methyltransferase